MDTILRQPGKTGRENLHNTNLTTSGVDNINKYMTKRNNKMKLDSIIFCLCAGLCSSALIDNAFSMNGESREMRNRTCKLDKYSIMIASKYFDTMQDFENLESVNSRFSDNIDKFLFNPISIKPEDLVSFENIKTLHLYTTADIENWTKSDITQKFYRVEVHAQINYRTAQNSFSNLKKLLSPPENPQGGYVIFNNLNTQQADGIGFLGASGELKFWPDIHITESNRESNYMLKVDVEYSRKNKCVLRYENGDCDIDFEINPDEINNIKPVYLIRNLSNLYSSRMLRSIKLPNSITSINGAMFRDSTKLTLITLPNSLKFIPSYTFAGCRALPSITIPNSVTRIENCAFTGCEDLQQIYVYSDRVKQLVINSRSEIDPNIIEIKKPEKKK